MEPPEIELSCSSILTLGSKGLAVVQLVAGQRRAVSVVFACKIRAGEEMLLTIMRQMIGWEKKLVVSYTIVLMF